MAELDTLLTPEMEELLRELAGRPRSLFLRADRRAAFRAVRSRTEHPVSAMALSDALERELVQVHRAELAEILRQACRTRLLEGEREKLFIMRYRGVNERVDPVPLADVKQRLAGTVGSSVTEPWSGAIAAIQQALAPEDPEQVSVLDLAALGQRLVPGDGWRVHCAMAYLTEGNDVLASKLAAAVLDGWPQIEHALRAIETIAVTEDRAHRPGHALELQDQACSLHADYPLGQINRLSFALPLALEREALDASARLEELVGSTHALVEAMAIAYEQRKTLRTWETSHKTRECVKRLESRLGRAGRRLASAFN